VTLDVDNEDSPAEAVAEVQRLYGRCDVLVNNAAILIDGPNQFEASLFDLSSGMARQTFETNVLGPMRLIQAVGPIMRAQGYAASSTSSGAGQLCRHGHGLSIAHVEVGAQR
jgi:NAD(P)-dependent dehydrogenase (short-subunit alcohol dehydrogenase family)